MLKLLIKSALFSFVLILVFLAGVSFAHAEVSMNLNLNGNMQVADYSNPSEKRRQEIERLSLPIVMDTVDNCNSFHYVRNMCEIVKSHLKKSNDEL